MKWKVFFASATGKYHLDGDSPCEDFGHYEVAGDTLIGVVCDGAGSAAEGRAGAEFFARKVTEQLTESAKAGKFADGAETDYREQLVAIISRVRTELEDEAETRELTLRDFACTLVGCIASRKGGCFFHIGDGFAIYMRDDDGESILSLPENGEHSDETYFATDSAWAEHLRVTAIAEISQGGLIGLMSDGTAPFAVNRPKTGFYRPFIDPVVNFLRNTTEEQGSEALHNVLADEKTYDITPDDKTLLLALAN